MMKKSIVLGGVGNKMLKGVLSIEKFAEETTGSLRFYNLDNEPDGILTLGLMSDGKVYKAGLTKKSTKFYTFISTDLKNAENFSCAVINFCGGKAQALLFGSTADQFDEENVLATCLNEISGCRSAEEKLKVLSDKKINYSTSEQKEIEKEIDSCLEADCAACKYREAFFKTESKVKKLEEPEEVMEDMDFFNLIKGEIDNLFQKNPEDDFLKRIIPNSKWVRVSLEDSKEFYVVGLIYENNALKYVAYGVPGIYQKEMPKQLLGYPIWLPLDESKIDGFGYYISYQDALTGEQIKANVI